MNTILKTALATALSLGIVASASAAYNRPAGVVDNYASYSRPEGSGNVVTASYDRPQGNGNIVTASYAQPQGNGNVVTAAVDAGATSRVIVSAADPSLRRAPRTSRNASSRLSGSTSGVIEEKISITPRETSE